MTIQRIETGARMSKAPSSSGSPTTTHSTAFPSSRRIGRSLLFTSGRDANPGERVFTLFVMDISSLDLGKPRGEGGGR
jgi:hypothetical protein